jgi:hypothetical protein
MHYIAEKKRMDVVLGVLYAVGLLLIGIAATVYWSNGSKTAVLWFLIGGVVWLIITAGLQAQLAIIADNEVPQRTPQVEIDRANIQLLRFNTIPIQDNVGEEPLKGWAIEAIFKNVGQTAAKQVRVAYEHQYFAGAAPPDVNLTAYFSPDASTADIGPGVIFRSETKKFAMDVFDSINTKGGNLLLYGEVRYADMYPGTEPHVTEFCASIVIKRDPHFFPGVGVPYDGALDFRVCQTQFLSLVPKLSALVMKSENIKRRPVGTTVTTNLAVCQVPDNRPR